MAASGCLLSRNATIHLDWAIMAPPQRPPDGITPNMRLWVEPPDLIYTFGRGELTAEDMTLTNEFYKKHIRDWPYVLLIGYQNEQSGTTADARKVAANVFAWVPFRGVCLVGGSIVDRTVGKMILTVINSLWKRDNPITFVKSDDEAREWIAQRRRDLAAKEDAAPKTPS